MALKSTAESFESAETNEKKKTISGEYEKAEATDEMDLDENQEEATVDLEPGGIHQFVPTLLRRTRHQIHNATCTPLEGGRSRIWARTSRKKLFAALSAIPNIKPIDAA